MNLMILIDGLRLGGKETQLYELIKGLINRSILTPSQIQLLSFKDDCYYDNHFIELGIQIFWINRKSKSYLFNVYKIFNFFKPRVVHSFSTMTTIFAIPFKLLTKAYLIDSSIRSAPVYPYFNTKTKLINKINYFFADIIISNSYAGLKSYKPPQWKSIVIHNGFEMSRLNERKFNYSVKKKFSVKTEKVVGMVASFSNTKDYETYIKAAKIVSSKRDDVTFLAIGDGINLEKCKELANGNDNIKFLGAQKNVMQIINLFDLGVLSTYTEGISNSIMEYMALGKPVITVEGSGNEELVIDKQTGFLISPKSVNELTEKILYLLDHKDISGKMGEYGRIRIVQEFSINKMLAKYKKIYENLLR